MIRTHHLLCLAAISACDRDKDADDSTPPGWPEGLEPVMACDIDPPGDGDMPEALVLESEEGEPGHVCAKAYVHAPLSVVREAMADVDAVANRRTASSWEATWDDPPAYDVGYTLHLVVPDILEVEFDLHVDQGLVEGTAEAPLHVAQRWEKVDGTPFIYLLEGSAQARAVTEDITELELVERLHGATGGIQPSVDYMGDYFADIVALSHGEPLPEFD